MKKLFTHENRMIVYNMKNVLAEEGFETVMMNEFIGGGVGDLPTFDTWLELWIEDENRFEQAQGILQQILQGGDREGWFCRGCQEQNDASFRICWNCGRSYE